MGRDLADGVDLAHDAGAIVTVELQMRSANAISWIEHGQYVMLVRLDNADQFWRIRDELATRCGLADPSVPWRGPTPG